MESLINSATQERKPKSARKLSEKDKEIESLLSSHRTRIKVVGCGGAGNNTLTRLLEVGVSGVVAVAVNTDAQDLLYADADEKILIGREITNGLGAGSNPEIGEKSARESQAEIEEHLKDSDLVFVTCGLGGGTGTGSAPVVAEIARNLGALTIAVVTLPFTEEGVMRWENAREGLEKLRAHSDTVIVVQNDRLLEIAPDLPLNQAFKVADEILANAVKGISELVTEKGLVNLDFADIRAVMQNGGTAMIGLGESSSENKAIEAVEMALQNPLLDVDITGAKSALIHIAGGNDMSLKDARVIMKVVAEKLDPAAKVIWGTRMDPSLEKSIRVMLIVTGLRDDGGHSVEPQRTDHHASPSLSDAVSETQASPGSSAESRSTFAASDTALADPFESKASAPKEGGVERPVFNKIFEEETQPDMKILDEAVHQLREEADNSQPLRDIKNAASALNNSAQLFAFNHISYLAEAVEALVNAILEQEVKLTQQLIEMMKDVVVVFQGLIYEDQDALKEARQIIDRIKQLLGEKEEEPSPDTLLHADASASSASETEPVSTRESGDEVPVDKKGKVGEVVNYVKNLLGDDRNELQN